MADRKLVSVVTGTWGRHELLMGAIENVREQTYRPLEHVIVADGPDPELREMIGREQGNGDVPIVFAELGFHSSSVLSNSISAAPFMVAQLMARGGYQLTLSDDERLLVPDAIEKMVNALEKYDLDLVYSQVEMYTEGQTAPRRAIGTSPPQCGQITQFLYRRDALDKGMLFRTHIGSGSDWDAVSRTVASGGRWGFIRETLASHRVDK